MNNFSQMTLNYLLSPFHALLARTSVSHGRNGRTLAFLGVNQKQIHINFSLTFDSIFRRVDHKKVNGKISRFLAG